MTLSGERKPRLLVLSHVAPWPPESGQVQRVAYMLGSLRQEFEVTLATVPGKRVTDVECLKRFCDTLVPLRRARAAGTLGRIASFARATAYAALRGVKRSNYWIQEEIFPESVVRRLVSDGQVDCVLFEYWHAADRAELIRDLGIPTVLDMHDILWRSFAIQLKRGPQWWRNWRLSRYRAAEEAAWGKFDMLIAINRQECEYVRTLSNSSNVLFTPMGIDISRWPYRWQPSNPPRLMFYGGLGGQQNQESALRCWARIMPIVWESMPSTEFWMVGSNPPRHLQELTSDSRVKVTGFVEDVSSILKSATAVLCPWKGTYGFRSRLIEVMSLGVPVIADADAVFGMDLIAGEGFLPASSDREFANAALALLKEPAYAKSQSVAARAQVEVRFDSKDIYGRMARDLRIWLNERRRPLSVTCV